MKQGWFGDRCIVHKEEVFADFGLVVGSGLESSCISKV